MITDIKQSLASNRVRLLNLLEHADIDSGKDGYQRLYSFRNRELFDELAKQGFFSLFITNRGVVVTVHQIVWFAEYGQMWLDRGLVIKESERSIHHKNSDQSDNSLENLVMVTNWEHQIIETSKNQYAKSKKGLFKFLGRKIDTTVKPRKNGGSLVIDVEHRLAELIKITRLKSVAMIVNQVVEEQFKLTGGWVTFPQEIVRFFLERGIKKVREACKQIVWQQFSWQPVISFTS
jgi:hypothetical protein